MSIRGDLRQARAAAAAVAVVLACVAGAAACGNPVNQAPAQLQLTGGGSRPAGQPAAPTGTAPRATIPLDGPTATPPPGPEELRGSPTGTTPGGAKSTSRAPSHAPSTARTSPKPTGTHPTGPTMGTQPPSATGPTMTHQ